MQLTVVTNSPAIASWLLEHQHICTILIGGKLNYAVHKGNTVTRLQQLLNISPEETMVFGDGLNDEDGVMRTIQQMLALQ